MGETDLISRRAAIDAIFKTCRRTCALSHALEKVLEKLPSAQPDRGYIEQIRWERDIAIQQLKDLGYGLGEKPRTDGDTISRQAAIEELERGIWGKEYDKVLAKTMLESLPSAQPERTCDTCRYNGLEWDEEPCDSCTMGGESCHWKPSAQPELNEWCHDCKEYDPEKRCCPRWGQVIKTALADAQPEQRWIPCSERLPEPDQICIVTDDKRLGAYEYRFHSENHDEIDGWTFLGRKIIAWMPLPEVYKGEK